MLDTHGMVGDQLVEGVAIKIASDRLVVADGPDPRSGRAGGGGRGQGRRQRGPVANQGRADAAPTGRRRPSART